MGEASSNNCRSQIAQAFHKIDWLDQTMRGGQIVPRPVYIFVRGVP